MARNAGTTSFMTIYDSFLARIQDDMYMELTELDTIRLLQDLLLNGMYRFEFPRFDIDDYEIGHYDDLGTYQGIESDNLEVPATGWVGGSFNTLLTQEEINILSISMVIEWLGQQLNITDLTKMMFSGSDFKFTSQANHMAKLKVMIDAQQKDLLHMQRLYKRRKMGADGPQSTMGEIVSKSSYGVRGDRVNRVRGFFGRHDI